MSILRKSEINELGPEQLKEKAQELKKEIMAEKSKIASGGALDNPGKFIELKRTIARIKTIAREKGYKIDG